MLYLARRVTEGLALRGLGRTALATVVAGGLMGLAVVATDTALENLVGGGTVAWATRVAAGVAVGLFTYPVLARRLGVTQIDWAAAEVRRRIGLGGGQATSL
jgi:hypothetical protein